MNTSHPAGMTGFICRRVDPAREAEAEVIMRRLMALSRSAPGFIGSEIFPPIAGVQDAYIVLYRFDSSEHMRDWLKCPERNELTRQIDPLLLSPSFETVFAHRRREPGTVSSVFSYKVRKGFEAEFLKWRRRIVEEGSTWEGYVGVETFDTFDSLNPEFVSVVRYDSREHLDAWLDSKERAKLMKEMRPLTNAFRVRRIGTGFEGWFEYSDDNTQPPVAWRQGLVVLSGLFPVIMTLRELLMPLFSALPFPVAFLILLTIDVAILTYFLMPHYSRFMNFWLRPGLNSTWCSELGGWAVILGLIGTTLALALIRHM
ncbi:MAG: antibiotic biosynthesis monooxygenase [Chthoniobacterales bacterium]